MLVNLATLVGVKNLELLIQDATNTYVVVDNDGIFECVKNNNSVNYAEVVGIGSFTNCNSLAAYLNLQKLAK